MIYRAADLEEIVGDLMDVIEAEKAAGARHSAEVQRIARENGRLRTTLCAILAATQTGNATGDEATRLMSDIERLVADALERGSIA